MDWKTEIYNLECIDKQVLKVASKEANKFLKKKILSFWDEERQTKEFFPAPQPVSLEKKDFETLRYKPYVICAKLDGERFLFFTTKIPQTFFSKKSKMLKMCFLINRKFEFFIINQDFNENIEETLLDGELIDNQFVVHDSIIVNGVLLKNKKWEERWRTCDNFITNIYKRGKEFRICLKKFYLLKDIKELFYEIKKENIKSDGIVFYPMNEPIKYKTQDDLFKWKPKEKHTIDFKIKIVDNFIELYVYNRKQDQLFSKIPLNRVTYPLNDNMILECTINNNTFYPFKIRNDKKNSNNYYTAMKTLLNVKENITENQLCTSFICQR